MPYARELSVSWGDSDPFGLAYFPCMLAWFNDMEHQLFHDLGYPIEDMIAADRTTFVMGELGFRFTGPAGYGDRVTMWIHIAQMREKTLHWECYARRSDTDVPVMHGTATRVYAHIAQDGSLLSAVIPKAMRDRLLSSSAGTSAPQ